jgi:hypothetical protein
MKEPTPTLLYHHDPARLVMARNTMLSVHPSPLRTRTLSPTDEVTDAKGKKELKYK